MLLGVHEVTEQCVVVVLDELSCRWPVSRVETGPDSTTDGQLRCDVVHLSSWSPTQPFTQTYAWTSWERFLLVEECMDLIWSDLKYASQGEHPRSKRPERYVFVRILFCCWLRQLPAVTALRGLKIASDVWEQQAQVSRIVSAGWPNGPCSVIRRVVVAVLCRRSLLSRVSLFSLKQSPTSIVIAEADASIFRRHQWTTVVLFSFSLRPSTFYV